MKEESISLNAHLETVSRLVARIENHRADIPRIEADLLLSALRDMYDAVLAMSFQTALPEPKQPNDTVKAEETIPAPLMADTEAEPVFAPEPDEQEPSAEATPQPSVEEIEGMNNNSLFEAGEETSESTTAQPDNINTLPEMSATQSEQAVEQPQSAVEKPQPEPEVKEKPHPAQPSLFDYFKAANTEKPAPRTLADTLGSMATQGHDHTMGVNKVQDLRTIININDKFSFMNELFRNNMKGYNDFIMRLNSISNRQEALEYVSGIAKQYNWDNESLIVKNFYSIFDRKF